MQSWVDPAYSMFLLLGKSMELEESMFGQRLPCAEAHGYICTILPMQEGP